MWRDESVTYRLAQRPLRENWALLHHIDAVHGLYYLLMHAEFAVLGVGLTALRLPSVAATVATTAAVTAIGSRLAGSRTGVLAGTFYTLLPVTQQYAQEGRSYALVCALVTWATYALVVALTADSRAAWASYALLLALAGWLNLFAVLALPAHGITAWRTRERRWYAAAGAVLIAVLPLAAVARGQAGRQLGWLAHPGPAAWEHFGTVAAAGLALACYARSRALANLAVPLLVVPPALLLTVSLVKPWYLERYVLYALPGLALLAAAAADRHLASRARIRTIRAYAPACLAALAAVAVLLPWSLDVRTPQSRKDDVFAVARAVQTAQLPGDAVLFMPSRRREWLLASPAVYRRLNDVALARTPTASHTLQGLELPAPALRTRMLATRRVIALTGRPLDPFPQEAVKRQVLARYFQVCDRRGVLGARVIVYARAGYC